MNIDPRRLTVPEGTRTIEVPKFRNGQWKFDEQMGSPSKGFVYIVRDLYLKKFYIGKKTFYSNARNFKGVETNWRKYKTSSGTMATMFKERPIEEFEFIALEQYKRLGALAYAETWSLCISEAPTREDFYNTRIEEIAWAVKEPISDRHKERLKRALNWEDFAE